MKKRDFIQHASIQFMPQTNWDVDQSIRYAEKLWSRLEKKQLGDTKPSQPKDTVNYVDKLSKESLDQFNQFWVAFSYKSGKQRATMRWGQLGTVDEKKLKKIVDAAKQTAAERKNRPDRIPVMAEKWLAELRFDDYDQTTTEKQNKTQSQAALKIRDISGNLNHAKSMAANTEDDFWKEEIKRLKIQLKQLREQHDN